MWSREPTFEPTVEQSPPRLPAVPGRELRRPARFVGVGSVCAFLLRSRSLNKNCYFWAENAAFKSFSKHALLAGKASPWGQIQLRIDSK